MQKENAHSIFESIKNGTLFAGCFTWLTDHLISINAMLDFATHIISILSFVVLFFVNYPKMKKGWEEFKKAFK